MRGEFIDVGGRQLYYYAAGTRGQGDPIILVHGLPSTGHVWGNLVPLLPAGRRIVVPDLLNAGRSDPAGLADLSIAGHAGRLTRLLDTLGIARAAIAGHHMGALVAAHVAATQPERVSHLALVNPMGGDVTLTGVLAVLRAFLPVVRVAPAGMVRRAIRRELVRWFGDPVRFRGSIDLYLKNLADPPRWTGFLRQLEALTPDDVMQCTSGLRGLVVPCLVVSGERDRAAPAAAIDALMDARQNATLDRIRDGHHYSPEESPEQVARLMKRMLCS